MGVVETGPPQPATMNEAMAKVAESKRFIFSIRYFGSSEEGMGGNPTFKLTKPPICLRSLRPGRCDDFVAAQIFELAKLRRIARVAGSPRSSPPEWDTCSVACAVTDDTYSHLMPGMQATATAVISVALRDTAIARRSERKPPSSAE